MASPFVSIGFPVRNGESTLVAALESLLSQDFGDFELIISDNASTDGTAAICREYARRDPRIAYSRNPENIGVNPNHDRVFRLSRGRYFAWTAADVVHLPGMLSRCVAEVRAAVGKVVLAYPQCELVDERGLPAAPIPQSIASADRRPHRRVRQVVGSIGYVTQHYGLIESAALRLTRLNGSYPSSDHVLTAELAALGEIREIPEVLLRRRIDVRAGTAAVRHSAKAWRAWLDPASQSRRSLLPARERLAVEYARSIWRLPLRPADKASCLFAAESAYYGRLCAPAAERWRLRVVRNWGRLKGLF